LSEDSCCFAALPNGFATSPNKALMGAMSICSNLAVDESNDDPDDSADTTDINNNQRNNSITGGCTTQQLVRQRKIPQDSILPHPAEQ
jgi:hypothetical protein